MSQWMSEFRFYSNHAYRSRRKRKKSREPGRTLQLLRVAAEIRVGERMIPARVLLNDVFPRAIFLFSTEPIVPDTPIAITIDAPKQFYALGRVVYSQQFNRNSRVLEAEQYPFRVAVSFVFDSEADVQEVRAYVDDLRARFVFK